MRGPLTNWRTKSEQKMEKKKRSKNQLCVVESVHCLLAEKSPHEIKCTPTERELSSTPPSSAWQERNKSGRESTWWRLRVRFEKWRRKIFVGILRQTIKSANFLTSYFCRQNRWPWRHLKTTNKRLLLLLWIFFVTKSDETSKIFRTVCCAVKRCLRNLYVLDFRAILILFWRKVTSSCYLFSLKKESSLIEKNRFQLLPLWSIWRHQTTDDK